MSSTTKNKPFTEENLKEFERDFFSGRLYTNLRYGQAFVNTFGNVLDIEIFYIRGVTICGSLVWRKLRELTEKEN